MHQTFSYEQKLQSSDSSFLGYRKIYDSLLKLSDSAENLFPIYVPAGTSRKAPKEYFQDFNDALNKFSEIVKANEPFVSLAHYDMLEDFKNKASHIRTLFTEGTYDGYQENIEFQKQIHQFATDIREQMFENFTLEQKLQSRDSTFPGYWKTYYSLRKLSKSAENLFPLYVPAGASRKAPEEYLQDFDHALNKFSEVVADNELSVSSAHYDTLKDFMNKASHIRTLFTESTYDGYQENIEFQKQIHQFAADIREHLSQLSVNQ